MAFFVLAGIAHLFLLTADLAILFIALLVVAIVFEVMWAGAPGQKASIPGFFLNLVAATAGLVLVECFAGSSLF